MNRTDDRRISGRLLAAALATALCAGGCAAASRPGAVTSPAALAPATAERQILVTFAPRPALELPRAGSSGPGYRGAGGYDTNARTQQLARRIGRDYGLTVVAQWPIQTLGVHCVVLELPPGTSRAEVIGRLEHDRRVESVQPMQLFTTEGRATGDPYRELQHSFADLGLEEAHRWASGAGVKVAIVDTGVDLAHPDLAGRIHEARDFVDDPPGPLPAEQHGTAVAGVIASDRDNGIGVVGVAPAVKILLLRGCWALRAGAGEAVCSSFTLAKAIASAVAARPDVLNLSLGGPWDPLLDRLVRAALAEDIVVVAAHGDSAETRFPSGVAGVVAVFASPPRAGGGGGSAGSGRGGAGGGGASELAAPGQEILTTVPGGHYDFLSGSSLAAAHVSGITALLLEGRRMKPASVLALLRETSRPGEAQGDPRVVDGCAALARVNRSVRCPPVPTTRQVAGPRAARQRR